MQATTPPPIESDPKKSTANRPCYFLNLPAELRDAIYELAVSYDDAIDLISLPDPAHCRDSCADSLDCTYPSITRTEGQIGAEALTIFFSVNRFIAEVRWLPVGTNLKVPFDTWQWHYSHGATRLGGTSGIRGLQNAFRRLGRRHCTTLRSLELTWTWEPDNEANLEAMAAWTALWHSKTTCLPMLSTIRHIWSPRPTWDFPHPEFDIDSAPAGPALSDSEVWKEREDRHNSLRIHLRLELEALASELRDSETQHVDLNQIKAKIVTWVTERNDPETERLKNSIRRCWQAFDGHGRYRHRAAHTILDTQLSHRSPLLKLTPELRVKIYAYVLDLHPELSEEHSNTCAITAWWGVQPSVVTPATDTDLESSDLSPTIQQTVPS